MVRILGIQRQVELFRDMSLKTQIVNDMFKIISKTMTSRLQARENRGTYYMTNFLTRSENDQYTFIYCSLYQS